MALLAQPLALDLSALSTRANLALTARVAVKVAVVLMTWDEAYRTRQTLRHLTRDQLRDVGISPRDALLESRRSFWRH